MNITLPLDIENMLNKLPPEKREAFCIEAITKACKHLQPVQSSLFAPSGDTVDLYCDGASKGNPGKAGAGWCYFFEGQWHDNCKFLGEKTNNQAEYLALYYGVSEAIALKSPLRIFMDSELVVRQIEGKYKVKNMELIELHKKVRTLLDKSIAWSIAHIPREQNTRADALSNKALEGH